MSKVLIGPAGRKWAVKASHLLVSEAAGREAEAWPGFRTVNLPQLQILGVGTKGAKRGHLLAVGTGP